MYTSIVAKSPGTSRVPIITDTLDPGETWEDERGYTQIRGLVLEEKVEAESKFLGGAVLEVSINAELDGNGTWL